MAGVNKVILVGNLGKDPEVRHLESGVMVANFTLATTESYKDRTTGERKQVTEWHNIVLWRGLAEVAEKYLKKGNQVYVEGKLRTRSWNDQEGNTRYTTEVVADNMTMLGGRPPVGETTGDPSVTGQTATPVSSNITPVNDESDDLPF
ncbi:MAG: single-stranded DNA-binding protein [Cyclobacteriaceae bacterium]|nr:single-stranded DNA-binding protein [Cyclobacteriaceae bacterium]